MARVSGEQRGTNVVNDHLADLFPAVWLIQQILTQRRGCDFRHVFVLGNRRDFRWR